MHLIWRDLFSCEMVAQQPRLATPRSFQAPPIDRFERQSAEFWLKLQLKSTLKPSSSSLKTLGSSTS